jgi:hypothetical protein
VFGRQDAVRCGRNNGVSASCGNKTTECCHTYRVYAAEIGRPPQAMQVMCDWRRPYRLRRS